MRIDYPRAGRTGLRRFIPSWRLVLGTLSTLLAVAFAAFAIVFAVAWATIDVPEENDVAAAQTSIVYWDDGRSEMARLGDTNRISVPLSDVPEHVRHAVLAAEDREFYEHNGFAAKGILRAAWTNFRTGSAQGGSTITQQYAKNAFLSSDKTFGRKFKELVLSLKLEVQLSKDEILERYLNTIFFGRGAYGIQTAAESYFDTDSDDLTLAQGAVLAAIINAPGTYNPDTNPDKLAARYQYVLDGMVSEGWLSAEEAAAVREEVPETEPRRAGEKFAGPTGHVLAAVQAEAIQLGIPEEQIATGGLRIVTTIDRKAQRAAVRAVEDAGPQTGTEGLRIGLAAVKPRTGEIWALYGGADYLQNSLNNATQAISQAGSTFKPFALAAATEANIGLDSYWPGNSPTQVADYEVNNYGDNSYGYRVSLRRATEQSINTAYVALTERVGAAQVKDAAIRAGVPADTVGFEGATDLTFVLGTDSPHTVDIANAYATFSARGERAKPTIIERIRTAEGDTLYDRSVAPERTFDESVADIVNFTLQSVVRNGTGQAALALGRPAAGKTGSTDDYKSAWFAGYTPQLATAVSFSKDDEEGNPISLSGTGGQAQFYGGGYPAAVWTTFMLQALEDEPVLEFTLPTTPPRGGGYDSPAPTGSFGPSPSPTRPDASLEPGPSPGQSEASPGPAASSPGPANPSPGPSSPAPAATPAGSP